MSVNKPYVSSKDVIVNVYLSQFGRYAHLTGKITDTVDNPLWGKCHRVYIYATRKTIMVKANNIISKGSLVEISYQGERFGVLVSEIDMDIMYVYDSEGNSAWVKVTTIQSVLKLSMMPDAQNAQEATFGYLTAKVA